MIKFGTTAGGEDVHALTLNKGALSIRLLTYGAILNDVRLVSVPHNLTLGSNDLRDYEQTMFYHGAMIGPVVNRIGGARATINGQTHHFEANQDNRVTLHSGRAGAHSKVWTVADHTDEMAVLRLDLPDGSGGFPGNRSITATFELLETSTLSLTLDGKTDAPTWMNFANHSYWTMDGGARYDGHTLKIAADHILPLGPDIVPTGQIADVTGTEFDFRHGKVVNAAAPTLDHNFCLSTSPQPLREVLWLTGVSGRRMTMATTASGLQVFDDRPAYKALAFEAQEWPDAPNHPAFPSIELHPGDRYHQQTTWAFD